MSLISNVRDRLQERKGEWPHIADATSISYSWLCKFGQGKMTNPGVKRLETIDRFLRDNPPAKAEFADEGRTHD